jgi:serine/threonine-protein kinase
VTNEPECDRLRVRALALTPDDPDPVADRETAEAGSAVPLPPGYEFLGKLDQGGMGVVVLARQRRTRRIVAVKTLRAGRAGPDDLARFRSEAVKLARLQHPNIVQIFEADDVDGRPYFAMEYVDGGSLQWLGKDPLFDPARAAELVREVAGAIEYAHRMKVVHRDLKPGNVLLTRDGRPKVSDFGLAQLLDRTPQSAVPGRVVGTAPYLAPELARAVPPEVSPSVDVYGLGAILYELLTGRPPFWGATRQETLQRVVAEQPAPPTRDRPQVPRGLEAICLTCLKKNPADRYATARAVAEDLQRFLDGTPIRARSIFRWLRGN